MTVMILSLSVRVSDTESVILPSSTTACPIRRLLQADKPFLQGFVFPSGHAFAVEAYGLGADIPSFHKTCFDRDVSVPS